MPASVRAAVQSQLPGGGTAGQVGAGAGRCLTRVPGDANTSLSGRTHVQKESSQISRSTSSTCTFSVDADDAQLVRARSSLRHQHPQVDGTRVILNRTWRRWRIRTETSANHINHLVCLSDSGSSTGRRWLESCPGLSQPHRFRPVHRVKALLHFSRCRHFISFPSSLSEIKNKNSSRANIKFRLDKLSHSAAVSFTSVTCFTV